MSKKLKILISIIIFLLIIGLAVYFIFINKNKNIEEISTVSTDNSFISKPDWLPENLTEEDILRTIQKVYWKFYFRPKRLWNLLNDIPVSQTKYIIKCMMNYHLFKLW